MSDKQPDAHSNYFNQNTDITTVDDNTVVVTAKADHRIFITDLVISSLTDGTFTLTDDGGTVLFGPVKVLASSPLVKQFFTPIVNETKGDQVEMDKSAADDDWNVFISGYYAP